VLDILSSTHSVIWIMGSCRRRSPGLFGACDTSIPAGVLNASGVKAGIGGDCFGVGFRSYEDDGIERRFLDIVQTLAAKSKDGAIAERLKRRETKINPNGSVACYSSVMLPCSFG